MDDNIGKVYGRWTIIEKDVERSKYMHKAYYFCQCSCGSDIRSVNLYSLKIKDTNSCGCLSKEINSDRMKQYNTYDLSGDFGIGYTNKGEKFYFDLEDYDLIKDYYWRLNDQNYFVGIINKKNIRLHKFILGYYGDLDVDHINGSESKHDNRKSNLRICNRSENSSNKIYKGYCYDKSRGKWQAKITVNYKQIFLGRFETEEEARNAYELAKIKYNGEFCPEEIKNKYNKGE